MRLWEELKKAALLGLARYPLDEAVLRALDELGINVGQADADVLLEAAATLHGMQRAGREPERHPDPLPAPVAETDDEALDAAAVRQLQPVFEGEYEAALPEVLALMRRYDKRLPGELLPGLFARLRERPAELEALRPLWGARGEWWLAQHPDYRVYARIPPAESWTEGDAAARRRFLEYLRRYRADEGRELLATSWDKLPKTEKLPLLETLAAQLDSGDLPFLRSLRTERALALRRTAARYRLRAGDTELRERYVRRFRECLTTTGSTHGPVLVFQPPDSFDEAAYGDGLTGRSGAKNGSVDYLGALVRGLPVTEWAGLLGISDDALSAALLRSDRRAVLFPAYLDGLVREADEQRLTALWGTALKDAAPEWRQYAPALAEAGALLPAKTVNALLGEFATAHNGLIRDDTFWHLLLQQPHPWSNDLTLALIQPFQRLLRQDDRRLAHLPTYRQLLRTGAYRIDPALLPTIENGWYTYGFMYGQWEQEIEAMHRVLLFRGQLRRALAGATPG